MAATNDLTPSFVMAGLASQRDNGVLYDVELQVEGKLIPAHRAVLAATSPFFYGMFTAEFREKNDKVIPMEDVTFEALELVVDAMYKFDIQLTDRNISEVFAAAHLLQVAGIVEKCKEYMIEKVSVATCFLFLAIAEKYELNDVRTKANEFILGNFLEVSKSAEFKTISKDALCSYLSSDLLNFKKNEVEVFDAALRWLEWDEERIQFVGEVMKNVRFMLINADKLGEISEKKMMENNLECQTLIRNALVYQANVFKQPLIVTDQNSPRGRRDILTILESKKKMPNGFKNVKNETEMYHGTFNNKTNLKRAFLLHSVSTVKVNNFLFLFAVDNESVSPVTLRYNASTDEWMDLLPVPGQGTVSSATTLVNDTIYLLGGMFRNLKSIFDPRVTPGDVTGTGYCYSIPENKWKKIVDMPRASMSHAVSSIGPIVYVSGGIQIVDSALGKTAISKKLFAYDASACLWLTKPSMNQARAGHIMEAIDSKLYVFCGTIEYYDAVSEQWTAVNNVTLKTHLCSSFVDGNIYFTGGFHNDQNNIARIIEFDAKSHKLSELETCLPCPLDVHFSSLMVLPERL